MSDSKVRIDGLYLSGVKIGNLPRVSFTSPGFLRYAMIQDMAWIDFSVSDFKINYDFVTSSWRKSLSKTPTILLLSDIHYPSCGYDNSAKGLSLSRWIWHCPRRWQKASKSNVKPLYEICLITESPTIYLRTQMP